jgi:hypothetical protein
MILFNENKGLYTTACGLPAAPSGRRKDTGNV